MQQKKSKKIFFYFFLLFLFGSINNIELINLKHNSVKNINILGLNDENNNILLNELKKIKLENIFSIDNNKLINTIEKYSIVEKYHIFKRYPDTLDIFIKKTKFLAKINRDGKTYLVGANGKYTKNNYYETQIPFIFGDPEIKDIIFIKKAIDQSKFSYNEIKNLYYFPSQRWDIEFKNETIIKLSKQNIKETLDNVYDFFANEKFEYIKLYDARIENQIILND